MDVTQVGVTALITALTMGAMQFIVGRVNKKVDVRVVMEEDCTERRGTCSIGFSREVAALKQDVKDLREKDIKDIHGRITNINTNVARLVGFLEARPCLTEDLDRKSKIL